MIDIVLNNMIYWICFILMVIGFFSIICSNNYLKKIIGLSILQTSVLLIFISSSYVSNSSAPILDEKNIVLYSNPLPHVLMLTAIVVGLATLSVGLAIIIRIKQKFGTIEEDEVLKVYDSMYKKD